MTLASNKPLDTPVVSDYDSTFPLHDCQIRVLDTTLRDGSHSLDHQFSLDNVRRVAAGLDAAGVDIIEVTHGDGLGAASFNYGFSAETDIDMIKAARGEINNASLAAVLIPGIGTIRHLSDAAEAGIDMVRIATHCTEADIAIQHIQAAKKMGLETAGFLMMSHMNSPKALAEQALIMRDAGADIVYLADSAGALLPHQIAERVDACRIRLDEDAVIGMHAHNNLGVGIANALAAAQSGAGILDGSCHGLGAGAGNAATEVLSAALDRAGASTNVNTMELIDVAEDIVAEIAAGHLPVLERPTLMLGYAGVYSSLLLHSRRAAKRYGVSEAAILVELGRRRVVAGQEDMIIDVALELLGNR